MFSQDDHDKKIHVRSKDPRKIARQFEKGSGNGEKPSRKHHHGPSEPRKVVKSYFNILLEGEGGQGQVHPPEYSPETPCCEM